MSSKITHISSITHASCERSSADDSEATPAAGRPAPQLADRRSVSGMTGGGPRAVGVRIGFSDVPQEVRRWVDAHVGTSEIVTGHRGGMSPGAAVTLQSVDGQRVFVKAVSESLNQQTAALFRAEVAVLQSLPHAPYRPALIDAYDDGRWVALLLEQIEGRYPDMGDRDDAAAVETTVLAQTAELTPPPPGLEVTQLSATVLRWQQRWEAVSAEPDMYLPAWAASEFDLLARRIERLATSVPATTLCHFDIRDDNLLIKSDGTASIFDWGMARLGPKWVDVVLLAVQQPSPEAGDALLERHLGPGEEEPVIDFLLAFASSQAWNARQPPQPSLPNMPAFCAEDARRMFGLVTLRLGRN